MEIDIIPQRLAHRDKDRNRGRARDRELNRSYRDREKYEFNTDARDSRRLTKVLT